MRKVSTSKRNLTAAIYLRLSRDDNLDGESCSITNQKRILTKAAKEKGYTNLIYFIDDGVDTATNKNSRKFKRCARKKCANAPTTQVKKICFPAFWFAPNVVELCIITSISAIRQSSILTARITIQAEKLALKHIMCEWTSWGKWC